MQRHAYKWAEVNPTQTSGAHMPSPDTYTDAAMIEALKKSNGSLIEAARLLGCWPETISHRAKKRPEVKAAIRRMPRGSYSDADIIKALKKAKGHVAAAAAALGCWSPTIRERAKVNAQIESLMIPEKRGAPIGHHNRRAGAGRLRRQKAGQTMDRLQAARLSAGMSQKQAGEVAGISLRTYQKIESGESPPRLDVLTKLAQAFGCVLADVLPENGKVEG
jgi:DNA-binding XRE family transcriptional regulator